MVNVRHHADATPQAGGRFNLLLSCERAPAHAESEDWSCQLPRLLAPLGVRAVVARSGSESATILSSTPIHLAIVDLGIPLDAPPDQQPGGNASGGEGGKRVLELLSRLEDPPPTLIVKPRRTKREDTRALQAALTAGAFAVLDRPVNLETVLRTMSRALQRHYADRWPNS